MDVITDERQTSEALRAVSAPTRRPGRYADTVGRYLGAATYPVLTKPSGPVPSEPEPGRVAVAERPARHAVVVGVDASPAAAVAVDQAVIEADLRGWPVRLLHVQRPVGDRPGRRDEGAAVLANLVDRVHGCSATARVVGRLHVGSPGATLVRESAAADLVVVGSAHGRARDAVGGSVSDFVAAHHRGPVLVVRVPGWPPGVGLSGRPVVVGVDGTPGSQAAVVFAAEEARLRGCDLVLLHAAGYPSGDGRGGLDPLAEVSGAYLTGLTVHLRRVDRPAGPALLDASRLAAAMVVGSRSAARFVGLPLGSVSRSLVHRAYCPVFVVH
jgi:nucleotide-binding universal stress UspA family protein